MPGTPALTKVRDFLISTCGSVLKAWPGAQLLCEFLGASWAVVEAGSLRCGPGLQGLQDPRLTLRILVLSAARSEDRVCRWHAEPRVHGRGAPQAVCRDRCRAAPSFPSPQHCGFCFLQDLSRMAPARLCWPGTLSTAQLSRPVLQPRLSAQDELDEEQAMLWNTFRSWAVGCLS